MPPPVRTGYPGSIFAEVVDVTGIVLAKLDGSAKGGIVVQVQRELGVPVKLVGLGEGAMILHRLTRRSSLMPCWRSRPHDEHPAPPSRGCRV